MLLNIELEDEKMSKLKLKLVIITGGMSLFLSSCGQDPAFEDRLASAEDVYGEVSEEGIGNEGSDVVVASGASILKNAGTANCTGQSEDDCLDSTKPAGGGDITVDNSHVGSSPEPNEIIIPGADQDETSALRKCLTNFVDHPFGQRVENFRKISAAVTVFGVGNAVDDQVVTQSPQLILISAAVNVLGDVNYNLLNPNGYYCIDTSVNVQQSLTINLDCQARLSDNRVHVNVGSNVGSTIAEVGVHVGSSIEVNHVGNGDRCLR